MHVNIQANPKINHTNDTFDPFRDKYWGFRYSAGECRITEIPAISHYFSTEVTKGEIVVTFLSVSLISTVRKHCNDFD